MRPVRRRFNFVSLISFSLAWGLLVFMLVLPFTASAANVTYETVRVGPGQYAPSGVQTPITVNVKGPGVSKFHQIVPVATPSTIGKLGRSLVRGGGVGLAISGAIEGMGYLVDRATGDIQKEQEIIVPGDSIQGSPSAVGGPYSQEHFVTNYCSTYNMTYCWTGKIGSYWHAVAWECNQSPYLIGYETPEGRGLCFKEPITEKQVVPIDSTDIQKIDNQLNTALSLAEKTAILRHFLNQLAPSGSASTENYPVSVSSSNTQLEQLYSDWPELRQSLQALVNAALAEQLALSDPEFSPTPDEQTIVDQGLEAPPLFPDFELPAFCEWASFICEPFIGEDQPDVPMLDLEAPDYDSGLPSGGTCPPPYMFNTGFTGPMEISLQPACDLATAIRAPLIAISYLMAGFIVVGVRR